MDVAIIADTVTVATSQTLGFAKSLLRHQYLNSAATLPTDALAPPPVRSTSCRTARRTISRRKRRTRRRSSTSGDDSDESGDCDGDGDGLFGGGSDDGPFGGGGYGGGRWNFDGFGGQNWDESSWWCSSNGFAFGFVYEVIYWIALSNCVHFAFKKMLRIAADSERDKLPIRLTPIC